MKLLVIQDRPTIQYKNDLYRSNLNEFNKYLKLSDSLSYTSPIQNKSNIYEIDNLKKIDASKINIINLCSYKKIKKIKKSISHNKAIINESIKKADLVVIKMPQFINSTLAINAAKKLQKPYILEVVGCAWDMHWYYGIKGKLFAPISFISTKFDIARSEFTIYVTKHFLQHRYPCKGKTLGCSNVNIVPINETMLLDRINKIRRMKKKERINIGTTGPVNVKFRGQEYVIRAISKLNNSGHNYHYYLAGSGDTKYLSSIAQKYNVSDRIHFLGALPFDKMSEFLDNIDIYIHPSKAEGLPRALIEAMSKGIPCFGSETAGIPELLDKDYLFKKGSVKNICFLLNNWDIKNLEIQSKKNHTKSLKYSSEKLDKMRLDFYNEIMLYNNKLK